MQKLVLSNIKRSFLALSVVTLIAGSSCQVEAKSCDLRTFNIKVADKVSTNEVLNQLSGECDFSIVTKDEYSKKKMDTKLFGINIKKMTLDEIFNVLISSKGLVYSFDSKVLSVSGLTTKTFKIDYISTVRESKSNTDISLTGDSGSDENANGNSSSLSTGATITSTDKFSFGSRLKKS